MITGGLSCDRVEFGHFGGGSDDPPDPPLATGLNDSPHRHVDSVCCTVFQYQLQHPMHAQLDPQYSLIRDVRDASFVRSLGGIFGFRHPRKVTIYKLMIL